MSVFHGVRDITKLPGRTFFKLAWRLDAYEGAFMKAALSRMEELREEAAVESAPSRRDPESRAMTAEELTAWDPGPQPGLGMNVGIFDYAKAS